MANFFKDYHATRITATTETKAETRTTYEPGQIVRINPYLDENRNGKRYFADYLDENTVLLAKTKREALNGYGYVYSIADIVNK